MGNPARFLPTDPGIENRGDHRLNSIITDRPEQIFDVAQAQETWIAVWNPGARNP
jgi:hypothetical protein